MLAFSYSKFIGNSHLGIFGHVDNFDDEFTDIYDYIKNLRGDYAVAYNTEDYLYLATSPLKSKALYFNGTFYTNFPYSTNKKVFPVPANTILKINKKNECVVAETSVHTWNNLKTNSSLDKLFDKFIEICPKNIKDVTVSSGLDTGCIVQALDVRHKAHAIVDDEDIKILAKRVKLFNEYSIHKRQLTTKTPNIFSINNVVPAKLVFEESSLLDTWVNLFKEVENKVLMGLGGDQLYRKRSYPNLEEMVDWFECVATYCGKQIINPLMNHEFYQLYLNTTNTDNWQEKFINEKP